MILALISALLLALPHEPEGEVRDSLKASEVTASLKFTGALFQQPVAVTEVSMRRLEQDRIRSVGDLSAVAPNFFQPRYGSHITSSLYFRGFGSRIDQPVVGVYLDDVPLLNKNAYDFDFLDLRRVQVLRGPQSVLFGRNTSLGVIRLESLSPFDWTGVKASAEAASNGSWKVSSSLFRRPSERLGWSLSAAFSHDGGIFVNAYTGKRCDTGNSFSLKGRVQWHPGNGWLLGNILQANILKEGGYAYGLLEDGLVLPVNYNDPSGYRRLHVLDGFSARKSFPEAELSAAVSWQMLADRMDMDNDFTPASIFSLTQRQREHGLTAEVLVRNKPAENGWRRLTGAFLFGKHLRMEAPVNFRRDGIDQLILAHANAGLSKVFPGEEILIEEQSFLIGSDFRIPVLGAALFHESSWTTGRWAFTAGLRLDAEFTSLRYDSSADIHYRFTLVMPEYDLLRTEFKGRETQAFFVPIPKIAVQYTLDKGLLYATAQRGHKAGGFNTQLFSDILQSRMMDGMMRELGVSMAGARYDSAAATRYKPESTWNLETGAHWVPNRNLHLSAALFWIECTDMQVTVMAPGMSTGRMMSNAAHARSRGAELSAHWMKGPWSLSADAAYTYATSEGKRIPHAPESTVSLRGSRRWEIGKPWLDAVTCNALVRGVGRIWWDEENTLVQPFYPLLSASVRLDRGSFSLSLWGENLTDTAYQAFWFRSLKRDFFAKGRPIRIGLSINYNI